MLSVLERHILQDGTLEFGAKIKYVGQDVLVACAQCIRAATDNPRSIQRAITASAFISKTLTPVPGTVFGQSNWFVHVPELIAEKDTIYGNAVLHVQQYRNHYCASLVPFLRSLTPNECAKHSEILLQVFSSLPELSNKFWTYSSMSFDPRPSTKWLQNMSILHTAISLPILEDFRKAGADYSENPPPGDLVAGFLVPDVFSKMISRGLCHADVLVCNVTCLVAVEALKRLTVWCQYYRERARHDSAAGKWQDAIWQLRSLVRNRFAEIDTVVNLVLRRDAVKPTESSDLVVPREFEACRSGGGLSVDLLHNFLSCYPELLLEKNINVAKFFTVELAQAADTQQSILELYRTARSSNWIKAVDSALSLPEIFAQDVVSDRRREDVGSGKVYSGKVQNSQYPCEPQTTIPWTRQRSATQHAGLEMFLVKEAAMKAIAAAEQKLLEHVKYVRCSIDTTTCEPAPATPADPLADCRDETTLQKVFLAAFDEMKSKTFDFSALLRRFLALRAIPRKSDLHVARAVKMIRDLVEKHIDDPHATLLAANLVHYYGPNFSQNHINEVLALMYVNESLPGALDHKASIGMDRREHVLFMVAMLTRTGLKKAGAAFNIGYLPRILEHFYGSTDLGDRLILYVLQLVERSLELPVTTLIEMWATRNSREPAIVNPLNVQENLFMQLSPSRVLATIEQFSPNEPIAQTITPADIISCWQKNMNADDGRAAAGPAESPPYHPGFLLMVVQQLVAPAAGKKMSLLKLIDMHLVGFVVACLSSFDATIRTTARSILKTMHSLVPALSDKLSYKPRIKAYMDMLAEAALIESGDTLDRVLTPEALLVAHGVDSTVYTHHALMEKPSTIREMRFIRDMLYPVTGPGNDLTGKLYIYWKRNRSWLFRILEQSLHSEDDYDFFIRRHISDDLLTVYISDHCDIGDRLSILSVSYCNMANAIKLSAQF